MLNQWFTPAITSNVNGNCLREVKTLFFPTQNELVEISRTFCFFRTNRTTKIVLFTPEFQYVRFLMSSISGNKEDVKDVLV